MTITDQASGPQPHPPLHTQPHPLAGGAAAGQAPAHPRHGRRSPIDMATVVPVLDVTIPVYNEQRDLEDCLRRLHAYLRRSFPHSFRITVADNASTDGTLKAAERVARELREVTVVHLDEKGRGNTLRKVWLASPSPVLAYMDVNLSTDLAALGPLLAPLLSGHSDLAIGTRLTRNSRVVRGPKREFISRSYNFMLQSLMGAHFSDAQCGFKAIRADIAQQILPHTVDTAWFFDTELLVLAERCGLRVHEVPVDWTDDPDSSVDIVQTALADVRGMARLSKDMVTGRIPVAELRAALAPGPLVTTAVANTAANRRFTFSIAGTSDVARHHFEGLVVFGIGLALTSGALALVHSGALPGGTTPDRWVELATVTAANLAATAAKFLLFRLWVFRRRPVPTNAPADPAASELSLPQSSAPTTEMTQS
ncbi:glycosyltransferase [Arthrobacter globiformis]|uniref:Glycosyltransferase family 2 protein n=1 Tax=Arthrobacter globiformis TaxID=1665 RepID=A0A328HL79_ARTGO|nr:glycosyltransferase [Arthrobacter globiformis]RAM39338.1 glycosyltransferase family 2 protein [Arthrobacter globiformis]